jgi:hypothetical protein
MTNLEKSFWDGFIKVADQWSDNYLNNVQPGLAARTQGLQQSHDNLAQSFDPNVLKLLEAGVTPEKAHAWGAGPRLNADVDQIAHKLQNIQGTNSANYIGEELGKPMPEDPAMLSESNNYMKALLDKTDKQMTDFKSAKPDLSKVVGATDPMSQEQFDHLPLTSVGGPTPKLALPPAPPAPAAGHPQASSPPTPAPAAPHSGMPGWAPWAAGIGAAGLGGLAAWHLANQQKKKQQPMQAPKPMLPQAHPAPNQQGHIA